MKLVEKNSIEFVEVLASKAAVPGGGGAAALVGAIGTALGSMVCNLTIGKKKYADFDESNKEVLKIATEIQAEFLKMVDEDADEFLPLSKAYGLPSATDEEKKIKEDTLEDALKNACGVPIKIVRTCYEAIKLHEMLVDKGSKLAISDVGVGVQCLRAALISGKLNVTININMIKDAEFVKSVKEETDRLVEDGVKLADKVYLRVEEILSK